MTRLLLSLLLSAISVQSQLIYHGGKVLVPSVNLYNIYYGSWSDNEKAAMRIFTSNIGGSSWFIPMQAFYDSTGTHVDPHRVILQAEVADHGSQGLPIPSGPALVAVVTSKIDDGTLPLDALGIYNVIGGPNASLGFPSGTAFHWGFSHNGAFIQLTWSHGNYTSTITPYLSHEIVETVANPQSYDPPGSGWHTAEGKGCADICGTYGYRTFGSMSFNVANYATPNGGCTSGGGSGGGGGGSGCPPCPPGKRRIGNCKCK